MTPYAPPAYKQLSYHPALGQTFDQYLGFSPAMGDALRLAYHAGGTWLGIYVGAKEKGFKSVVGWVLGIGMGIAAGLDLLSLGQRAAGTHPPAA